MEWLRDLVIVIFGLGATIALIVITTLAVMCYLRIRTILDSVKTTTKTVENITQTVQAEVAGPLGQVIAVIRGFREGLGFFSRKKKR
jgi:hypothetical protein